MRKDYQERVNRQVPLLGEAGQEAVFKCRVCVVGNGGTGSPYSIGLALMGFGEICGIDFDFVEWSNLARSFLWGNSSRETVGRPKAEVVAETINSIDQTIKTEPVIGHVESHEGLRALTGSDAVVLCVDRNEPRIIVNGYCAKLKKPLLDLGTGVFFDENGTLRELGWRVSFYRPGGACLQCIYLDDDPVQPPEPPASYLPLNLGAVSCALDMLAAYISGYKQFTGNHILFDGLTGELHQLHVSSRPDCPLCGGDKGKQP